MQAITNSGQTVSQRPIESTSRAPGRIVFAVANRPMPNRSIASLAVLGWLVVGWLAGLPLHGGEPDKSQNDSAQAVSPKDAQRSVDAVPVDDEGFEVLFDGESLANWRTYQQPDIADNWRVKEGQLFGTGRGADLITKRVYADFELQFQWKIEKDGNSGVIFRATEEKDRAHRTGIEYQLIDDQRDEGQVPPVHSAGAIYGLYCEAEKTLRPVGEYNSAKIIARGNHIEHWLNDELVASCEIGSEDWKQKIAASKFQAWTGFATHSKGHIALQAHGHPVWFRQIRIKPLAAQPAE